MKAVARVEREEAFWLPLARIKVGERRRRLIEERIAALAESIASIGQLNPITVTPKLQLIAGAHRLEAMRRLGHPTILARVVDLPELDRELAEIDENLIRAELDVLEQAQHLKRRKEIYEARHPDAPTRAGRPKKNADTVSPFSDDTATSAGVSSRTIQRGIQIAEGIAEPVQELIAGTPLADSKTELIRLARLPEVEQAPVAKKIVAGEAASVRAAHNALVADNIRAEPPSRPGKLRARVIVADPPWRYEKRAADATHRAALPYPDMTVDDICALPVASMAHEDCVLWLWTTNAFMRQAFAVLDAWGFQEKTILTWVKDRMGTGDWLRGQTEHCILAVRGRPTVELTTQTTVLHGALREHSRKPESFYELVETLCPGSKLELFGRQQRPGWTVWGAEGGKFDAQRSQLSARP